MKIKEKDLFQLMTDAVNKTKTLPPKPDRFIVWSYSMVEHLKEMAEKCKKENYENESELTAC